MLTVKRVSSPSHKQGALVQAPHGIVYSLLNPYDAGRDADQLAPVSR